MHIAQLNGLNDSYEPVTYTYNTKKFMGNIRFRIYGKIAQVFTGYLLIYNEL